MCDKFLWQISQIKYADKNLKVAQTIEFGNFNRFACFWPKGYQLGSLGKSHQNGDYLKQAMRKIVFPQESNLQPLDYRSTALPLELEKTPPRMLNFGYLNPATCLLYDCNNMSIKMFFDVCWPEFNILIVLRTSNAKNCLPTGIEPAAFGLPVHCSTTWAREDASSHA